MNEVCVFKCIPMKTGENKRLFVILSRMMALIALSGLICKTHYE